MHMTDNDGKTCLHHAAQSKALVAQNVVSTIIAGGPNLGKFSIPSDSFYRSLKQWNR